ncbi:MAG: single-stranded DNA-binding protein [Planctomycetes bacterium]|nr:single-stranded DNA-binding protein [Planctomycetota bacterium]
MDLITITRALRRAVRPLRFGGEVALVYNPLDYAWRPHTQYLERYGGAPKEVLLVGMNPGPHGMVQTGVPFGQIAAVRDWLGIEAPVGKPVREHPGRPVLGFACTRSEVSGARFWGWARARFDRPEAFFARFFVHNYCPLAFFAESGRNLTPDKLPAVDRERLFAPCDRALLETVRVLRPELVVGLGAFAERRARVALPEPRPRLGRILHPSPASPAANRGWAREAERALRALGVALP